MKHKCLLCDSEMSNFFDIRQSGYEFSTVKCEKCGFVSIAPRPDEKRIKDLYKIEYFRGRGFDKSINYIGGIRKREANRIIFDSRLKNIERLVKKGLILDAGCGLGDFVLAAKSRGWTAEGVEISEDATKMCRRNGIKVYKMFLERMKIKNRYDCIIMVEVIEHLMDPVKSIKNCYQALKDGGLLVVQTGNVESIYAKFRGKNWFYFLYGHLNYFSPKTLRMLLEMSNFKIEKIYFGDEIGLMPKIKSYWKQKSKASIINWINFFEMAIIQIIRQMRLGNLSVGGMIFYARKV